MKKKLLSLLLASVTAFTVAGGLVACDNKPAGSTGVELPTEAKIEIWCPDGAMAYYTSLANKFKQENAAAANWEISFEGKEESDVKSALGTDPASGASMFFIAGNAISDLVANNVLQPLVNEYAKDVRARDSEAAISVATYDDKIYAYPNVNSNGYFLMYDSAYLSDDAVMNWDTLLPAIPAGKNIMYDYNNGFYNPCFFYGLGCGLGDPTHNGEVLTDMGAAEAAAKTMIKYFGGMGKQENPKVVKPSGNNAPAVGIAAGTCIGAIFGTWINEPDKETGVPYLDGVLKDWTPERRAKIKYTKLPQFTVTDCGEYNGTYDMGSLTGAKYLGINAQKDRNTIIASLALGNYFNTQEAQIGRFEATQESPTNKEAAKDPKVLANPMIAALTAQNSTPTCVVNMNMAKNFWKAMETFGNDVYNGVTTTANLTEKLNALKASLSEKG